MQKMNALRLPYNPQRRLRSIIIVGLVVYHWVTGALVVAHYYSQDYAQSLDPLGAAILTILTWFLAIWLWRKKEFMILK
jgi:hypothetical protein